MQASSKAGAARRLTVLEVVKASTGYLEERGVPLARQAAEHLVARALGCRRLDVYLRFETVPAEAQLQAVREGLKRLAAGEPLQYVLGDVEFMGHVLRVDRRVLIPRPETEQVVERALAAGVPLAGPAPVLADVGTGSGCVAIALALAVPAATVLASDIDPEAVQVAVSNAAALGVGGRVHVRLDDLLGAAGEASLDLVVANLPYVASGECDRLDPRVRDFEPRRALDGGVDGLDLIRRLAGQAARALRPGRLLVLEIGHDQGSAVKQILEAAGFEAVRVERDLAGHDRIALALTPGQVGPVPLP